jgi:hypothetical protein
MTARSVFYKAHEAGARADEPTSTRLPYRCVAHGCPMPGVFFDSGAGGICGWHYGAIPSRWPTITQILGTDWACVTVHYCAARRVLADVSTCMDDKARNAVLDAGRDLVGIAPGWGLEPLDGEDLDAWGRRLGDFLHGAVLGKPKAQHHVYATGTPGTASTTEKQWAFDIVARHAAGALVSAGALRMAREVVEADSVRGASAPPEPATNPEGENACPT